MSRLQLIGVRIAELRARRLVCRCAWPGFEPGQARALPPVAHCRSSGCRRALHCGWDTACPTTRGARQWPSDSVAPLHAPPVPVRACGPAQGVLRTPRACPASNPGEISLKSLRLPGKSLAWHHTQDHPHRGSKATSFIRGTATVNTPAFFAYPSTPKARSNLKSVRGSRHCLNSGET